jgi:hypothetical protein
MVQESQTCSVIRTADLILMDTFTCIMIFIASIWYPHLPILQCPDKGRLSTIHEYLHLSVFTPNQVSALHVPEDKQ